MVWKTATIVFDLYKVQSTDVDVDGFILIQPDWYGEKGGPAAEYWAPFGIWGRPLPPDVDEHGQVLGGCNVMIASEGGKTLAMVAHDPRTVPKLPPLKDGEVVVTATGINFMRCEKNGAVTMFATEDNTANGRSCFLQMAPTGQRCEAPWGYQRFDATGFHVKTASGARFDLGGIGMPAPLDQLNSYALLKAASIKLSAPLITLGPLGGVSDKLAKATTLLAALTAVSAAIKAANALAAAATPGAGSGAAAAASTAALAALDAALATAAATMPTSAVLAV